MDDYDELLTHVKRYWADQKRSASETRDDLTTLVDEIQILIETLPTD